jgi:hypothetical protein
VALLGASTTESYGNLPLAFEPNLGLTRSAGMLVFFTDNEALMVLNKAEKPFALGQTDTGAKDYPGISRTPGYYRSKLT